VSSSVNVENSGERQAEGVVAFRKSHACHSLRTKCQASSLPGIDCYLCIWFSYMNSFIYEPNIVTFYLIADSRPLKA